MENAQSAINKNSVVGMTGSTAPIMANPTLNQPNATRSFLTNGPQPFSPCSGENGFLGHYSKHLSSPRPRFRLDNCPTGRAAHAKWSHLECFRGEPSWDCPLSVGFDVLSIHIYDNPPADTAIEDVSGVIHKVIKRDIDGNRIQFGSG